MLLDKISEGTNMEAFIAVLITLLVVALAIIACIVWFVVKILKGIGNFFEMLEEKIKAL
jgi:uncharacterized membrane protein